MRGNAISKRDAVILRELATNARTPITRIAKILSISDVAVKRRIVKLEESGIIKKYTIVPNNKKLGYDIVALIGVNTNPDKVLDVLQSLKDKDNVTYMALTSGDHDLLVEVWAKDSEELAREIEDLRKLPGVTSVYPSILLDVVKEREPIPQKFFKSVIEEGS